MKVICDIEDCPICKEMPIKRLEKWDRKNKYRTSMLMAQSAQYRTKNKKQYEPK